MWLEFRRVLFRSYDYYTVSNKGFSSTIKAKIIMQYNKIINIEILSQDDSYFQKILDNDFINKLIDEQDKIKDADVVSGATISSNALKELVNETLIYHNNKLAKSDFYIKSKKMVGEIAVYEVVQKGFGGKIEMTITIGKNQIKAIQIGKNSESYLEPVKKDFISNLIQFNGEVDTVSGVTVSTTAIKNAVQKVVADNEVVRWKKKLKV